MVGFTGIDNVYLYPKIVDMRKGVKSLSSIICELTTSDQRKNSAFVFLGTSRKMLKIIFLMKKVIGYFKEDLKAIFSKPLRWKLES